MNSIENKNNFGPILESDEQILWTGKPFFPIFLATGIPFFDIWFVVGGFRPSICSFVSKNGRRKY
jgi:hypothetical protein